MKKLIMMFAFLSFAAIAGVNAQSCHKGEGKACCAKKAEGTSSTSSTQVAGEEMVKKTANTTECTKGAAGKACCAKGTASCSKDKAACSKKEKAACGHATTDAVEPEKKSNGTN